MKIDSLKGLHRRVFIFSFAGLIAGCKTAAPEQPAIKLEAVRSAELVTAAAGESKTADDLAQLDKPAPVQINFHGCAAEGEDGDPILNRRKNRVDSGNYVPFEF